MALSESARQTIRAALQDAPRGHKGAEAARLAETFGVSVAGVYRAARLDGTPRARAATRPEYREWTRIAVHLAHRVPGEPLTLDLAIEGGVEMGVLPAEAAAMPVQTARRIARELGLRPGKRRTHRMHADYPMQAIQVDASQSKYLAVEQRVGDDWRLRLHRRPYPASGYKNKPLPPDRMRLWVYSGWDMCTGYHLGRYTVALGETALDAAEFLVWAWGEAKDPRIPLRGIPDDTWLDLGPAARHGPVRDLLARLKSRVPPAPPYAKERMGGVERSHRTRWDRFERSLFLRGFNVILLSELNARLVEFAVRENGLRVSRTQPEGATRPYSRTAAWPILERRRPADRPLRACPPDAIATIARERPAAHIDFNGVLRWDGEYEVPGWSDRTVIARRAVDGTDTVTVEDPATGERRTATPLQRRDYGDIRTAPATALDRLLAGDAPAGGADLYAPAAEGAQKVVGLPSRAAETPLDNPLDADRLPDIERAMALFMSLYPHPLSAANVAAVRARIQDSGLSRQAVTELAQTLAGLTTARRA